MQARSALQVAVPHFLALPVSWVMYATLAASVGNILGWRLKTSWHCVKKLLHSPGEPSFLLGGGRRGLWVSGLDAGGGGADPWSMGAEEGEVQEAGAGCAAWTPVDSVAIWWVIVWTHCMTTSSCCC